ncbi:MAG TPA: type II toxin-antitoxin system VapC family toxin [Fibrobacteria bacterium]|nr:type II toxin-antitoxin system VapC family toxin [Fibrobacteria bacterium]
MFLLDTNIIIYTLKNRFESIRVKIENAGIDNVCVSSLTVAEMEFGAAKSQNPDAARARLYEFLTPFEILPFDAKAAEFYGRIRAAMEKTGNIIGPMDLLIASIAAANHCCVVTNNTKEFLRVPNLQVENWVSQ